MGKTLETLVIKSSSLAMKKLVDELRERKAEQIASLRKQVLCVKKHRRHSSKNIVALLLLKLSNYGTDGNIQPSAATFIENVCF